MTKVKYNIKSDLVSISEGINNQFKVVDSSPSFDYEQMGAEKPISKKICVFFRSFWTNTRNNTGLSITIALELKRKIYLFYRFKPKPGFIDWTSILYRSRPYEMINSS